MHISPPFAVCLRAYRCFACTWTSSADPHVVECTFKGGFDSFRFTMFRQFTKFGVLGCAAKCAVKIVGRLFATQIIPGRIECCANYKASERFAINVKAHSGSIAGPRSPVQTSTATTRMNETVLLPSNTIS